MLGVLITAAVLSAAPTLPEAEQARFKSLVLSGEHSFGEGDYGFAIWCFRQADAIKLTPEVAYNLAKTHEKLNDAAMASYYYRLYLRRAPEATDALEVAEVLGDALAKAEADGRGLVEIDTTTPASGTLNGRAWAELPIATFLPPGDYALDVRFTSGRTDKQTVSVLIGRTASLHLDTTPPPLLDAEGGPAAVSRADSKGSGARPVLHTTSMALLAVSALAVGAGAVFGMMNAGDVARLNTQKQSLTVSEANRLANNAEKNGATANLFFAAGGAGLVAGGALFVFTLPEPGGAK